MRTKYIILSVLLIILLGLLGWFFMSGGSNYHIAPNNTGGNSIKEGAILQPEKVVGVQTQTSASDPFLLAMQTPITFFGIVIDQNGAPVPEANVEASVLDNFTKGSPLTVKSDNFGKFAIQSKGMSLHVAVSKNGYYQIGGDSVGETSSRGFEFAANLGRGVHKPDPNNPVIFNLHKSGSPVKLLRIDNSPKIQKNGNVVKVIFDGNPTHSLAIRCWTHDDKKLPDGRYDWKCEIDVPDGGLQESSGAYDFIAPDVGYTQNAIIEMPLTIERLLWKSDVSKRYWVKFNDGIHANVRIRMIAAGDHFAVIQGYLNPTPGSRNLEPDLLRR